MVRCYSGMYGIWAIPLVLSAASMYYAPNIGFTGLYMPFNGLVWVGVALSLLAAAGCLLQRKRFCYPRYAVLLLLLPVLVVASGFMAGVVDPVAWLLRVVALLLSVGFLFGLFQLPFSRRGLETGLLVLLAGLGGHAFIGLAQMLPVNLLPGFIPYFSDHMAVGIFQQPNVQASAMALALVLAFYLILLPGFRRRPVVVRVFPFVVIVAAALVLLGLGSRVGLLGAALGLVLVWLGRYRQLWRRKLAAGLAIICLLVGAGTGMGVNDGFLKAYSKFERLSAQGADARVHVYRVGLDLIMQSPVSGYGIGSFTKVFHEQAAEYMSGFDVPPVMGNEPYGHPHNELLYWGIEGGLLALLGIAAAMLAVLLQLYHLGWQRGTAMAGLLLPIALHAMVELPFYHSAYHWFVLLFLVFVILRQSGVKSRPLGLSKGGRLGLASIVLVFAMGTVWFCGSAIKVSQDFTQIYAAQTLPVDKISAVHAHPYFSDLSGVYINTKRLMHDLSYGDREGVERFVEWAEAYLEKDVELGLYGWLMEAYRFLGEEEKAVAVAEKVRAMFPRLADERFE